MDALKQFVGSVNVFFLAYFLVLNLTYMFMTLFAFWALRRYAWRLKSVDIEDLLITGGAPPVTLIAPSYNEEATCVESTRALLSLNYPEYEVLIVNDGSKDGTLARLQAEFQLVPAVRYPTAELPTADVQAIYHSRAFPNLWLIHKRNGGKADALNTGLNFCRTPLFCAIDADSLLERDALIRVVRPFLEDRKTIAVGGIIRIVNGCTVENGAIKEIRLPPSLLARFQVLEYLRAFLAGRMGCDALDASLIISGAFGLFARKTVIDAGGYAADTVGEDMELIVRLHRHCREKNIEYGIRFIPDPVAWTECPEDLRVLGRQRDRWQRGLIDSLARHRALLFNPEFGRIGLIAYPAFFFYEMLGAPIEVLGYALFVVSIFCGIASYAYVAAFLAVAFLLGISLSISAVGLEELCFRRYPRFRDVLELFLLAILDSFSYRYLTLYWRLRGTILYFCRAKGWGKMERKGFHREGPVLVATPTRVQPAIPVEAQVKALPVERAEK